jgi:hypothetical protein
MADLPGYGKKLHLPFYGKKMQPFDNAGFRVFGGLKRREKSAIFLAVLTQFNFARKDYPSGITP